MAKPDPVLGDLLTQAKYWYDNGSFGVLQQAEFFKAVEEAIAAPAALPSHAHHVHEHVHHDDPEPKKGVKK